ncbi:MAG: glycosyltransferase family 39 protein [Candidatus Levybacteria bacterium]|nr:glycosyltransferase family 39 protein [Candidatus Levybacteria bacterium]
MDNKYPFGWDQLDNAWAAQKIIVNHELPLVGMVAKQNSGFFIGPLYYYLVAFFYWLTNLNPVASHYIALVSSVFTFWTIFYIGKRIFTFKVALLACFVNAVVAAGFAFDAVQWPVSLLPGISLIIFYFLYKLLNGEEKYVFFLAIMVGLAFHIHFTAIFFPIIIMLCLPFFPKSRKMLIYLLLSIPLFLVWFIPNIVYQMQNSSQLSNLSQYLNTYYHGLHLQRFMQLTGDGLIQFNPFLSFDVLKSLKVLIIPIFLFVLLRKKLSRDKIVLSFMILVFFLVPWVVFSTYKGEISDYYFSINRFISLLILCYLLVRLLYVRYLIIKIITVGFIAYYSFFNISVILNYNDEGGLRKRFEKARFYVENNQRIEFQEGVPEVYIYYYLMRQKGVNVY